jgi:3-oxoacyl-[acyl-carrier-protein] synthase III
MRACLAGWGTAVPEHRLTNAELETRVETSDEWIVERTGIRERRAAAPDETTASLTFGVSRRDQIRRAHSRRHRPPDRRHLHTGQPLPHTGARRRQARYALRSFDQPPRLGSHGLVVGSSMIQAGIEHVLVVGGSAHPHHRSTARILFGDGAAALC